MGHVMFMRKGDVHTEPVNVAIGTVWLFTSNDSFAVPVDGKYRVEVHGGGGGGAYHSYYKVSASGGGSGEVYEDILTGGTMLSIAIGNGGASATSSDRATNALTASAGGTTTCGNYSCIGGGGGKAGGNSSQQYGGTASGSLGVAGTFVSKSGDSVAGGDGNKNNTPQTYGDGGSVTGGTPNNGQPGAVIITYLGKE